MTRTRVLNGSNDPGRTQDSPELALLAGGSGLEPIHVSGPSMVPAFRQDAKWLEAITLIMLQDVIVLQELKEFEPAPCVIMLTNYPYPQYRKKCLDMGADYFLDKSADFDGLITVIRQLRDKADQQRNLKE